MIMKEIQKIADEVKLCYDNGNIKNQFLNKKDNISWSKAVLHKLSQNWENRAQARNNSELGNNTFLLEKKDFLSDLLPFKEHPIFIEASEEEKNIILTCGWLAYNEKTIELENFVLMPTCSDVYNEVFPGVADDCCKEIVSETIVDESYHVLLTLRASQITRRYRKLEKLKVPKSNLIFNIQKLQSRYPEPWQKSSILLATAIVTEIFVGGYLSSLAHAKDIQPLSSITANAHMMDELAHSCIFKELTKLIYSAMSITEKEFFARVLPYPVCWLVDNDLNLWDKLLQQINFKEGRSMINDCKINLKNPMEQANFSDLIKLAEELGIYDINTRILECVDSLNRDN